MTELVRKHTIPKFRRKLFQSVVQNMNRCHVHRLVKRVAAAKDPNIRQDCAVQGKNQTKFVENGSKTDEIEKKRPNILFSIQYSNYIKDGRIGKIQ